MRYCNKKTICEIGDVGQGAENRPSGALRVFHDFNCYLFDLYLQLKVLVII